MPHDTRNESDCTESRHGELGKSDLLAELSHNLQTPLAVLKARVAQLRMNGNMNGVAMVHEGELHGGSTTLDELAGIDHSIDTLSRAIAELLAASVRPPEDEAERAQETFSLSTLLEELAEETGVIAELQGIFVRTDIASDARDLRICSNQQELREALMNVLANAVKYMGGGSKKEICSSLALAKNGTDAIITIADTGIGIPPEDLPHIFNRFYRSTRVYGVAPGMGLGLASVERIIRAHDGHVEITSEVGVGTTVTITLPQHGRETKLNST